jgi:hypothetical protein
MNKVFLKSLFVVLTCIVVSSCAVHSGNMASSGSLSAANFSYVKKGIKGEAKVTYVLAFGGLAKKSLIDKAKQQMLESYDLKDNQALSNLTVNYKSSFFPFYRTVRCIVTADVVQFK